jgi:hypothetical protein
MTLNNLSFSLVDGLLQSCDMLVGWWRYYMLFGLLEVR